MILRQPDQIDMTELLPLRLVDRQALRLVRLRLGHDRAQVEFVEEPDEARITSDLPADLRRQGFPDGDLLERLPVARIHTLVARAQPIDRCRRETTVVRSLDEPFAQNADQIRRQGRIRPRLPDEGREQGPVLDLRARLHGGRRDRYAGQVVERLRQQPELGAVAGGRREPQPGQDPTNARRGKLIPRLPTPDRNPRASQRLVRSLDQPPGPGEDRRVAGSDAPPADVPNHPVRFRLLVGEDLDAHRIRTTIPAGGHQRSPIRSPRGTRLHEPVRAGHDLRNAPAALRKAAHGHSVVLPKRIDPLRAGAVPLIDHLIVVGHCEHLAAARRPEFAEQGVLGRVRVLVLVHQDMGIHDREIFPDRPLPASENDAAVDQRAVVQAVVPDERRDILRQHGSAPATVVVLDPRRLRFAGGRRPEQLVEIPGDLPRRRRLRSPRRPGPERLGQDHRPFGIEGEDPEVRAESQVAAMQSKDAGAERVEGREVSAVRCLSETERHARLHLARRQVREGQAEHPEPPLRCGANDPDRARRKDFGFACTRAGEDQERPSVPLDGATLRFGERDFVVVLHTSASATAFSTISFSVSGTSVSGTPAVPFFIRPTAALTAGILSNPPE